MSTLPFWLPASHDVALAQGISRNGVPILSWIDCTLEAQVIHYKQAAQQILTNAGALGERNAP